MKTLQINNKHYRKCDVVMLSSKTQQFDNYLVLNKEQKLCVWNTSTMGSQKSLDIQHIYILSNDEIKEGDWYIWLNNNQICKAEEMIMTINNHVKNGHIKKIIATTDKYLGCSNNSISHLFAQIPQSFIEYFITEYNKGNVISKVLVEVEEGLNKPLHEALKSSEPLCFKRIKLNQNNEISILTEQKQVFSREEVVELIKKSYMQGAKDNLFGGYFTPEEYLNEEVNEWIQENLK